MVAIHERNSTVAVHFQKIQTDELSYQPEKLYTEALLKVLSKAIVEEINRILKRECMVCYDPAVQIHSSYMNSPLLKKQTVIFITRSNKWLAKEAKFEKAKDKIHVAVKDKDLCLMRSELLRNVFFMDQLKAAVMKWVL